MRRSRIHALPVLLAVGLLTGTCRDIEQTFLAEDTPIDPCDPTSSTYHGYAHFIERDFLNNDGTLDYRRWFEKSRVEASDCDPLHPENRIDPRSLAPPPVPTGENPAPPAQPTGVPAGSGSPPSPL